MGAVKFGRAEEEVHRIIVANYEDKQKELLLENRDLRGSLHDLQQSLIELLNSAGADAEASPSTSATPNSKREFCRRRAW